MKKLLSAAAALLTVFAMQAQNEKYVPGEILVQLEQNYAAKTLMEDSQERNLLLNTPVTLSRTLNMWKLSFDPAVFTVDQVINALYKNNKVLTAQVNHLVSHRATEPDDPQYAQQWQYYQANDKDIDADEAWDITTGGMTANGHEIVVAIIDDGLDFTHPDIVDNLWTNTNEIDGNNIDDDGNGFIDDVIGWNAYNNTDNIGGGGHGTPVTGIVGAKGDNGIGVAGVNWNVKLMIIQGGGAEAEALAAYSYALENRKLYNETNGAKGAFVVATNASWGVDQGQPADAPLWCAMYDTLGENGILNTGATANAEWDIDVIGDLPTGCPSEFLIAVTNMNRQDEKVNGAGYGDETIDLGAPGQGTWTTAFGNSYGGFGGTSGATPHVTGTIALLYAAPSMEFADLAISDPEEAARKVKDYILDNVDPNPSLVGITTTEGRLNVFNAIQALVDDQTLSIDGVESTANRLLSVYPNPTTDFLQLAMKDNQPIAEVSIYSMSGKLVKSFTNTKRIDVSKLMSGSYILRYKTEDNAAISHTVFLKR